jgi:hypothetical protein
MRSVIEDIQAMLDTRLGEFQSEGEDLAIEHEFIANFVGADEVLRPAYARLTALGCTGEPPAGGGWIYMHIRRPLSRGSVLTLASALDDVARSTGSLFELLDVTPLSGPRAGQAIILGACDGEAFENA